MERLTDEVREERVAARDNRATIHRRLDEQAAEIADLKTHVAISGQIDAQVREEIKALAAKVDANHDAVSPSVEEWKRMKTLGLGLAGLLAVGGLSVGAMLTWASETAVTTIRHWLRIA